MEIMIDPLRPADWDAVRAIYREGIATGNATFETEAPTWERWDENHLPAGRLVARAEAGIVGWVALSPVSRRPVYAGVAEVSVYVAAAARGHGVGRSLLAAVIAASEKQGIWTLQAGIFPENAASLSLFRRAGFRELGIRERIGQHHGVWRTVLLFERRSLLVGVE